MDNQIFKAIIDLLSILNRPDRDKKLMASAGVQLEEPAFKVLVGIGHLQSTAVGELADQMGRNYSSVSRQIDKLEAAGYVHTYPSAEDSRIRISELTPSGQEIYGLIQSARQGIMREALSDWTPEELASLLRHLTRLSETLRKIDE